MAQRLTAEISVYGKVQGVGFRPLVCRLAEALGLTGFVRNAGTHVDIIATGKHLEKLMKEEGVSPKIFARIMGWEKPQAVYRWYYGETLPSVDTLSVLAKILNRPIESLLIMREIKN